MFNFYRDANVVFISFVFPSEGLSCVNVSAQFIYTQVLKLDRLEFNMYIFEKILHKIAQNSVGVLIQGNPWSHIQTYHICNESPQT